MTEYPIRIREPLIVPASLDPDAVKILRRLRRYRHEAYLVGGCVRDLSLGRIPKDFDIATSARPRQIKRLFRNSRIIGRRFKLVHIQFGDKIIEVSTFRKNPDDAPGDEEDPGAASASPEASDPEDLDLPETDEDDPWRRSSDRDDDSGFHGSEAEEESSDLLIRRDNVFGTAEEDAVRRDFTINGLFYDIEDGAVIDYVGGTEDLGRRLIRTIGDPEIRLREDPVRILRAIKFAARLDFDIEPATYDAMVAFRSEIRRCAPPRVTEELLKVLSCGAAREAIDLMDRVGVLEVILPEIAEFFEQDPEIDEFPVSARERLFRYLDVIDRIDRGRRLLSNPTLLTVLLSGPIRRVISERGGGDPGIAADRVMRPFATRMAISRRDAFRVKQIVVAQPRLRKPTAGKRRRRVKPSDLVRRDYFKDALDFLRIESEALGLDLGDVERWEAMYLDHLKKTDRAAYRKALRESLFRDPVSRDQATRTEESEASGPPADLEAKTPDSAGDPPGRAETAGTSDAPSGDAGGDGAGEGSRRSRKRRRSKKSAAETTRVSERRRHGEQDEPDASQEEPPQAATARNSAPAGKTREKPSSSRSRTRRTGRDRGKSRADERSRSGRRGRSGGERSREEPSRIDFDEVRSGSLSPAAASLGDDGDEEPRIPWDAPLPTVGDPGPISMIRTGIDQTEKKSRRRKKQDSAARERSKEISDQPALQAFKMIEGDPRGHEATTPRKPRRNPSQRPEERKDPPFRFLADFEWIEELFRW